MIWLILQAVSYSVLLFNPGGDPLTAPPVAVIATFSSTALSCGPVVLSDETSGFRLDATWYDETGAWRACQTPPIPVSAIPVCAAAPCPVYQVVIRASSTAGSKWSDIANPPITTRPQPDPTRPACLPPLGNRAVAVFPTGIQETTGNPGSRSRMNYQLASPNAPITTIRVRIDGVVSAQLSGDQLLDTAGIWFTVPPSGTHTTSLQAVNEAGCAREVAGPALVVP